MSKRSNTVPYTNANRAGRTQPGLIEMMKPDDPRLQGPKYPPACAASTVPSCPTRGRCGWTTARRAALRSPLSPPATRATRSPARCAAS